MNVSNIEQDDGNKLVLPLEPRTVLMHFTKHLLEQEKSELLAYDMIYYLPLGGRSPSQVGCDTDKGEYQCQMQDHIAYRYEIVKLLGRGSFGQVYRCVDHMRKEVVALKILRNKKRLHKQGLVEVRILERLRDKDPEDKKNCVRIKESFVFRQHLILVFELLSLNLYEFIKMNNFQGVSVGLVRRFAI